ncbi:DUF6969 family protein [Aestuariispira insulae]|uniref:DUF6969 domain-containing protein n=1 Tax=Aestuariispira insulae TaxID=1461337 RepID=A0A3D9HDZ1_9PROT|nr:hypothetical protein [Aestuariispira insulae]RED47689.1 hypothetical protein DFP90_10953 [Aestuariispira insulae]
MQPAPPPPHKAVCAASNQLLARSTQEELEKMLAAGERILESYRVLKKGNDNVVSEVLKGQGTFYEMDHYPKGDAYDPESHSQYYYHSHRPDEHGHFHLFLREAGMSTEFQPSEQSQADYMDKRDDNISHLIAISMDKYGFPVGLFTTNRWVTAENWYRAGDVIAMLDHFEMDLARPSWPVNIWITDMVRLFRPQIENLIRMRDQTIAIWTRDHPDRDVFEDRALEVTSEQPISVEEQIRLVRAALA